MDEQAQMKSRQGVPTTTLHAGVRVVTDDMADVPADAETIGEVVAAMDDLNLQVMVQTRGSQGERLTNQIEAVRAAGQEHRFRFFTTLNLRDIEPGSGARIAAQLEADVMSRTFRLLILMTKDAGENLAVRPR